MTIIMSIIILYGVVILFSLTVNVNSQSCTGATHYSPCSSNIDCQCLLYPHSDNVGVCTFLVDSCSDLVPCELSNNTCAKSEDTCVLHPRCSSIPICYPSLLMTICSPSIVMTSARSSIIVSNYSSALDSNDGRYTRPDSLSSGSFRYEAMQIIVDTTGTYDLVSVSSLNTIGYLYNDTFYPTTPSINLIQQDNDNGGNNQFKLTAFLQAGVPYTLVLSTQSTGYIGPFSIVASGPGDVQFRTLNSIETTSMVSITTQSSIITSNYTGILTTNNQNYTRHGSAGSFYYQAIEVRVSTTGTYTFRTSSSISDTYGYLYQGNFYPTYPQYNIVTQDDDGAGNGQFQITTTLRSDMTYILVFTSYYAMYTGSFDVVASGPDNIFMNSINVNTL